MHYNETPDGTGYGPGKRNQGKPCKGKPSRDYRKAREQKRQQG